MKFSNNKSVALTLTAVFYLSACGEDTSSKSGDGFNKGKDTDTAFNQGQLISNIVDNVITPTFEQFSLHADEQTQAIKEYCQQEQAFEQGNVASSVVSDSKLSAQNSWRTAMSTWQQAEVMQLGPLLDDDSNLRNNIYSWPIVNTCGVDLDVTYFNAGTVNGAPYDITKRTASRKSMLALEYLLFNDDVNHSCTGAVQPENWNNETEQYRKLARCEFASEVALDVHNNANDLLAAWQGENGYGNKLKTAGTSGSEFNSEHDAVNVISDAMFYIDLFTKDGKLAEPLGLLANECGSQACPQVVESKYSQNSFANIINNLIGFNNLLLGENDGLGFKHYLIDVGDQETADIMAADLQTAINSTQSYQNSLAEVLATTPEQVEQTHTQVKKVTDKLKVDFITSLALELPKTAAGDND